MGRKVCRVIGGRYRRVRGRHRYPMDIGMDINPGGVTVGYVQRFMRRRLAKPFLDAWSHGGLKGEREMQKREGRERGR